MSGVHWGLVGSVGGQGPAEVYGASGCSRALYD